MKQIFTPVFSGIHVTWSLVLCVCFVDRCLSFWPLCCLSFFDLQILIIPLVSYKLFFKQKNITTFISSNKLSKGTNIMDPEQICSHIYFHHLNLTFLLVHFMHKIHIWYKTYKQYLYIKIYLSLLMHMTRVFFFSI